MAKILKFYSPLCGPCKVLEQNLKDSSIEYVNVNIFEDECIDNLGSTDQLVEHYGIKSIPALVKINDSGDVIDKKIGILSVEQLKEFAK